jgi:translation initiation factor IF-3
VPVPRRFDRRPPERDTTRINERIRVPEVRLIDDQGQQVGVLKTADALVFAQERELDLVEVAPEARPPVCRVLDYSKYKYEQAQKLKQARKHQQQITVREIKFRPKIAEHDYDTKKHHVERFLKHKDKVKVTIMFRGREVTHPERGTAILDRLAEELSELGVVEQRPMQEGRNMTMMMAPSKAVLAGRVGADGVIEDADGVEGAETAPEASAEPSGSAADATAVEPSDGAAETESDASESAADAGAGASESAADAGAGASESAADAGADTPESAAETDTDAPDGAPETAVDAGAEASATPVPEEGQESEGAAANTAVP